MGIFQQASLTDLRTLKYVNNNGDAPYVYVDIPLASTQQVVQDNIGINDIFPGGSPIPNLGSVISSVGNSIGNLIPQSVINTASGLVRGGFPGAVNASFKDTIRIGKFLNDSPQGPLFKLKQIGLQLSNPLLETPRGNFLENLIQGNFSTLLGGGNGFSFDIGETRIYNNGINTLAQVATTAFGVHLTRHGLVPIPLSTYADTARDNDPLNEAEAGKNNRLVRLQAKLKKRPNANISQYISGPGSIDGIGITTIPRFYNTLSNKQYLPLNTPLQLTNDGLVLDPESEDGIPSYSSTTPAVNYYNAQGVSLQLWNDDTDQIKQIEDFNNILPPSKDRENTLTQTNQINQNIYYYGALKTYDTLLQTNNWYNSEQRLGITYTSPVQFTPIGTATYKNLRLAQYNIKDRLGLSSANGYSDEVNLTPLYYAEGAPGSSYIQIGDGISTKVRDLIKFRIEAVDNDDPKSSVWMIFRAYLKDIIDTPNPSWNTINYVGRGEPFYIYKGFERNISFTLQVAAMSEAELKPMWQKLNYLYSNTMPDYSSEGVMRGPYMRLTLGDYIFRQPGIIKNMTYTINNDSPWEIAIDEPETGGGSYELPHVMTIQITFAPIHDFVPRKFPTTLNTIQETDANNNPQTVDDWRNLPAFMADRQANKNEWLTSIFGTDKKIPTGKSVTISSNKFDFKSIPGILANADLIRQQQEEEQREFEKEQQIIAFAQLEQDIAQMEADSPYSDPELTNKQKRQIRRIDRKEARINKRNAIKGGFWEAESFLQSTQPGAGD